MIAIDPAADMLGVIDVQPSFMPGGALPVPAGDEVVPAVNRLLRRFPHAFATQDWHPPGHVSFASAHPGRVPFETVTLPYGEQVLWPDHAVQGSREAELHPGLDGNRIELVLRKGVRPAVDGYSAFTDNDHRTSTGLDGWLRARGVRRLFLCGLAADYCVAWSAEDSAGLGYETWVVEDACRGIGLPLPDGGTTIEAARARLAARGVRFTTTAEIEETP